MLKHIKEKRKIRETSRIAQTENLEDSLARGPPVVQGEYEHDFRRFGEAFAVGDRELAHKPSNDTAECRPALGIATDALKDIVITLQMTLLQNLQLAWSQDTMVDFTIVQNASDDSRVNSVVALGQLYQRLAIAAPLQQMPTIMMPVTRAIDTLTPVTPVSSPALALPSPKPKSVTPDRGRRASEKMPSPAIYNLFRRPKSDNVAVRRGSQESLVPRYLLPAISADKSDPGWLLKEVEISGRESVRQSVSSTEISSDASSLIFEPNDLSPKIWESPDSTFMATTAAQDPGSLDGKRRVPTSTLELVTSVPKPRLLLPCEENRFAGFCKACLHSFFAD